MTMTNDEKKRGILEELGKALYGQDYAEYRKNKIDQALSQLNALDKPRIDEEEMAKILFNEFSDGSMKWDEMKLWWQKRRWFQKAHAIAEKAGEIVKR